MKKTNKPLRSQFTKFTKLEWYLFIRYAVDLTVSGLVYWAACAVWLLKPRWFVQLLSTDAFGFFLLASWPIYQLIKTNTFWRYAKKVVRWMLASPWRPYWLAVLATMVYMAGRYRPWGLGPALFLGSIALLIYLQLHVGDNFGTGLRNSEIELKARHHPIGYVVFCFESLPKFARVIPVLPVIWFLAPFLIWYLESDWIRVVKSEVYWLAGIGSFTYWLIWTATKWRKYGQILTKRGDILAVSPQPGLKPGVRIAQIKASEVVSMVGEAFLGAYPLLDLNFRYPGGESYRPRWVSASFYSLIRQRVGGRDG